MVAGISGTVGGVTYSRGHTGPYAKQWAQGGNPRSAHQVRVRGQMTAYGAAWAGMGSTLQAAWDAFALVAPEVCYNRLGEVILLSGWAWFVRVNQRRASAGLAVTTSVPATAAVAPVTGLGLACAALPAGPCVVTWSGTPWPAGYSAALELGVHTTGGAQRKTSGYKLVWAVQHPAGTSVTITSLVAGRFGSLQAGWQLFGRCYVQRDDGIRSPVAVASTVVT